MELQEEWAVARHLWGKSMQEGEKQATLSKGRIERRNNPKRKVEFKVVSVHRIVYSSSTSLTLKTS